MRTIRIIGHNDLRVFLRNKASFIWLFVMPLAFVYFMGFANRGPGDPANPRPSVVVENSDTGFLGGVFLDLLGTHGLNALAPTNAGTATRGIRLATNFTAEVLASRQSKVESFTVADSGDAAAALVDIRVARALININSLLLEHATSSGGAPPTLESLTALRLKEDPVRLDVRFAGRKPIPSGFNFSLPGVMVMYLMMNLLTFGGAAIAWERRSGVLRRITVHPVSKAGLIAGKLYGLMLLAGTQIAAFVLAGALLFRVNVGANLFGILVALLVYAWVAASLGLLVGSLVRSEDKVVGVCILTTLVMAALGGCWWPLEVVPDSVKILAHCIPTGWAMDALHCLISFGGTLGEAKRELGVLALFGAAANLAAVRFFRI